MRRERYSSNWTLTPGEKVAGTLLQSLDNNADGKVTSTEARSYALGVLGQSTLTLGGTKVQWTLDSVEVPPVADLRIGSVLKIYASAKRKDQLGPQTLSYQNRYQPAKSQWMANIFLLPGAGWQYGVTGQQHSNDGTQLSVKYTVIRP